MSLVFSHRIQVVQIPCQFAVTAKTITEMAVGER